jgi:hypothetical protein
MTRRLTRLTVAALSAAAVLPAGAVADSDDDARSCRSTSDLAQTFAATGPNAVLTVTGAAEGETIRFRHRRSDRLVRIRRGSEAGVLNLSVRTAEGETVQYEVVRVDDRDDGKLRLRLRIRLLEGEQVVDTARVTVQVRAIPAGCRAGDDDRREDRREDRGRGEDRRQGGDDHRGRGEDRREGGEDHQGRHRGRDHDED